MPSENVHHRKGIKKYSIVLIPGDEAAKTKSFSVGKLGAAALLLALFFVIVTAVVVVIIYTPAGTLLPISSPKLEQTYGKQIVQIQEQVNLLLQEMIVLRGYNLRLRKALGENVSSADSALTLQQGSTSSPVQSSEPLTSQTSQSVPENSVNVPRVSASSAVNGSLLLTQSDRQQHGEMAEVFPLTMPADGYLTRGFDVQQNHYGIDIAGKEGSVVLAAADGNIVFAGWTYDDGFMMIIGHSQGYMTVYKHNQTLLKSTGSSVKRGDVIALLGNTGKTSSGPHLHFEVWKDGVVYNPNNYLLMTQ